MRELGKAEFSLGELCEGSCAEAATDDGGLGDHCMQC